MRRDCLRDLKTAAAVLAAAVATVAAAAEQAPGRRLQHDLAGACGTSVKALLGALAAWLCRFAGTAGCRNGMMFSPPLHYRNIVYQHSNPFVTAGYFGVDCSRA